jgi:uncharacterized protein (DUF1810 family)
VRAGPRRLLGPRLRESAEALRGIEGASAQDVLGPVDALKLRSSLTLFALADPTEPLFSELLARFFGGVGDERTETALS